jgi:hypothetical protein
MMAFAAAVFVFACAAFIPQSAHAYLLPLIGTAGAFITLLTGVVAVLLSAVYLLFYNIHRWAKKRKAGDKTPPS